MKNSIIETFDLTKIYSLKGQTKKLVALSNLNISIKEGEIFGLLGPNGAGKTTLINILTTLRRPTSGYAVIDGYNVVKNPKQTRDKIALMLDNKMLYFRVTGYDNLKFFCKLYKIPNYRDKINDIVEKFGLKKWLNQYVEKYSSGMKMKLALCRTLLLDRKILFLDEPTVGLDVKTISFIIDILKKSEKTILLTSHDMNVVEKLCSRIAFINKGKILKIGTKEDIKSFEQETVNVELDISENKNKLINELNQKDFIKEVINIEKGIMISLKNRTYYKQLAMILSNYNFFRIKEQEMSLEDLFLKIY